MNIIGLVRDIQPSKPQPQLELYLAQADRSRLPQGSKAPIVLEVAGTQHSGTICTANANPPYLHHGLTSGGKPSNTTKLLIALGVAEKARLEFAVASSGVLRLVRVIDPGKWRAGNEPGERGLRALPT